MGKLEELFDVSGRVAAVTGGGGILCSTMAKGLAALGVKVAVLDIAEDAAKNVAEEINSAGGKAKAYKTDVLDKSSLEKVAAAIEKHFGPVDMLVNGAGGNSPKATTSDDVSFFDLPKEGAEWVFTLNFMGTLLPCQVFGKKMAERKKGLIVNISSMAAFRPLTKVVGYSAAKAAVSNFTNWLAVHMNQNYSADIRINAIAPGFFLTTQNHYLLVDKETGKPTPRGKTIIGHTPAGRYGVPDDLVSTLVWLMGPGASFVNGIVVPVDGGFSAFSGV